MNEQMGAVGVLLLAALCGLNPWVVLVIVVGLATHTRHAPLNQPFSELANTLGIVVFAAILGIDVVVSKLRRAARLVEPVNMAAAAVTGALLPLALLAQDSQNAAWFVVPGLAIAVAVRYLRQRSANRLNQWLRPYGHVAAGIVSDVLAGSFTAAVFAIKP